MSLFDWAQLVFFFGLIICLTPFLGTYMYHVFIGNRTFATPLLGWLETSTYKAGGINPLHEMTWVEYCKTLLLFNLLGFLAIFFLQILQFYLPLNPQHFTAVSWDLAFNTAISFVTNTDWQSYAGETTLSYFTQMIGLTTQNFLSAGTGIAILLALIRGLTRKSTNTIGNFWVDITRSVVYILLPLSIILSLVLISQGVIQTFSPYVEVTTLENVPQTIPLGPVASQVAIKQLGTNGGGFFQTNSAHPFENPNALTNFLETLALVLIPAALTNTYGHLIGSKRQGWLLLIVILVIWIFGLALSIFFENIPNPNIIAYPNLEGMETRFGITNSLLWSTSTTAISNGSVNAMLSSLSPIAGGIALFNIMLGELVFGGIGVGLASMIMSVLITVFLSGLMVGRTPEYLGKKIEKREIRWVMICILTPGALVLIGAGITSVLPHALANLRNQGPHGLTEILYAFTSAAGNNGSAFAGLNSNTPYFNMSLGIVMFLARLSIIIPSLAVAGLLAKKKVSPPSHGTFSTDTYLFSTLLLAVIIIVGALTFFPALSLGPIVEQILMMEGRTF